MWAEGIKIHSKFEIEIFSMPPHYWSWRMQGSAYTMANVVKDSGRIPDLFLVTDMLDLSLFKNLMPTEWKVPCILYMHENQLTYPISQYSKTKHQDLSYGYLNYKSCLVADYVLFNSTYHQMVFLEACVELLKKMPDYRNLKSVDCITNKSSVIPIGLDTKLLEEVCLGEFNSNEIKVPTLLFNHRWEYDKQPELFLKLIELLENQNFSFKINITSKISEDLKRELIHKYGAYIDHIGYLESYNSYLKVVSESNILPVTSIHDFFGISVLEAIHSGCYPILPADLCYQEHFLEYTDRIFYHSEQDFFDKTLGCIESINKESTDIKNNYVLKDFSWVDIIKIYDMFFYNSFDGNF